MALPLKQRQTLVLRFYADLSVEATAEIMNCSTGTVKSQTAKGLASLRQHLLSSNNTSRGATP
jgi:RNA polymerase sigma factor (sigma-70 family)